jgi:ATP-binding cassette subfamily B protein
MLMSAIMTNQLTPSLSHFLISLVKPYKKLLSTMALIGLCWALINTFTPYLLKLIIDHVVDFKGDKVDLFKTTQPYVFDYIALWVALCFNMRLLDWVKLKLFPNLREDVMCKMFNYLNQHSHHYFQNNFSGSLINKITDMQSGVIDIFSNLDDMYAQTLGLSVAIITLLFIHPIFAVILMGWAVAFLLITFLFLKPIQQLSHVFAESKTSVVGRMVDSISNIINVRLFVRHTDENRYIHQGIKNAVQKDREMQAKIIKMRIFWDISIIVLVSLNLFILLHMYSKNLVSIGDFTFVISLSISILSNLWFIAGQFVSFSEQIGICKQALSIVSLPHEIVDVPDAKSLISQGGRIKFHNVTFHYDEGAHLFKNKNIVIEAGQKVGLVGFSGSGKSTFVNLILRLFEVESGEITIDNQNINQVTQKSLREQIALIPQDITLFHRSLIENIRFGNMQATDNEIFESAKKANCHEFISQLVQGYDSMVGERGIKLSTGQRQRIAIARAMLKNAPILILDEATSALDSITEKYIQDALHLLMQNKTTIVIAHRLSTLSKMDRILVFDKGEIIEDGTHESLITKGGHYAKMWQMQAGGFLPEKEE